MKIILVDAVFCFVSADGEIFQEMYKLLESYPNRKILLTGANDEQFVRFGLDRVPYEVFTLKHEPEKTNPAYYQNLLEHFGIEKNDVVYFEHDSEAVKSAESIGILSYHYEDSLKDLVALKDFLDTTLVE